jgi:hypothetical protein
MSKECILSILKKTERSETILRNSAVRYSIFCSSLFSLVDGCQNRQFNHQETVPFWCSFIKDVIGAKSLNKTASLFN